jgi:hypothetical protein
LNSDVKDLYEWVIEQSRVPLPERAEEAMTRLYHEDSELWREDRLTSSRMKFLESIQRARQALAEKFKNCGPKRPAAKQPSGAPNVQRMPDQNEEERKRGEQEPDVQPTKNPNLESGLQCEDADRA